MTRPNITTARNKLLQIDGWKFISLNWLLEIICFILIIGNWLLDIDCWKFIGEKLLMQNKPVMGQSWASHETVMKQSWDLPAGFLNVLTRLLLPATKVYPQMLKSHTWITNIANSLKSIYKTWSWLAHDLLMTYSWLARDLLMTCSWSAHELLMTC
jgi:hypothetical protein